MSFSRKIKEKIHLIVMKKKKHNQRDLTIKARRAVKDQSLSFRVSKRNKKIYPRNLKQGKTFTSPKRKVKFFQAKITKRKPNTEPN